MEKVKEFKAKSRFFCWFFIENYEQFFLPQNTCGVVHKIRNQFSRFWTLLPLCNKKPYPLFFTKKNFSPRLHEKAKANRKANEIELKFDKNSDKTRVVGFSDCLYLLNRLMIEPYTAKGISRVLHYLGQKPEYSIT